MPAFAIRDVSVTLGDNHALRDVSLEIPDGFLGSVIGPAGSGKSTLLRLLNRLLDPSEGSIAFADQPLTEHPIGDLRRRVALVFQGMSLFDMSVEENLRLMLPWAKGNTDLNAALREVGLDEAFLSREGETLSAGERARVLVARALMASPEVLLIDEIIANLDPKSGQVLIDRLIHLNRERGLSVIQVSHNMAHVRALGGRCIALGEGTVDRVGSVEEVLEGVQWTD